MQKSLIMVLLIALAGSHAVYASADEVNRSRTTKIDDFAGESAVTIKSTVEDAHRLSAEVDAGASTTRSIPSDLNRPSDMAEVSGGQVTTGTTQTPLRQPRHKHHLRNALIIFGACFAMALVIAVASK